jgi:hypothetical protein
MVRDYDHGKADDKRDGTKEGVAVWRDWADEQRRRKKDKPND